MFRKNVVASVVESTDSEQARIPGSASARLSPEDIVANSAADGDLTEEIKRAATAFGKVTITLGVLALLVVVFAAGAWTHEAFGSSSPTSSSGGTRGALPGQQASGTASGGQSGARQGANGRGTTGTVDRVDGSTVYLKTLQGNEITVSTADSTTVDLLRAGKAADLQPGTTVTAFGQTGADGKVTAQTIVQQPAPAGG